MFDLILNNLDILAFTISTSSSSTGDDSGWIMLLPPGVATAIYVFTYRYYRNHDKRYKYESETKTTVSNLQMYDQKVNFRSGLRSDRIDGDNSRDHTQRVKRRNVTR